MCGNIHKDWICPKCNIILGKEIKNFTQIQKGYKQLSVFAYEGIIRDLLIRYKFKENAYLFKTFAKIMLANEKVNNFLKLYDIIIPVPLYSTKRKLRGYNQTELIAKELARRIQCLTVEYALIKVKNTLQQSTLTKVQRRENVKKAYQVINNQKIIGKKVLLIDDIYTTGNTVMECCKVLEKAGVTQIGILTIAKDI